MTTLAHNVHIIQPVPDSQPQTCSGCFKTTTEYETRLIDRRTAAQVRVGREPSYATYHVCLKCLATGR